MAVAAKPLALSGYESTLRGFAIAFLVFWSFGLLVSYDEERLMTEGELLQFQARKQNYKMDIFSTPDTQLTLDT